MIKKLCLCLITFSLLAISIIYENKPPKLNKVDLPPISYEQTTVVLPLDGRPPCTKFVSDLGLLASVKVILPPNELLGNYTEPAQRTILVNWLTDNIKNADGAIISSDLLIHGGLVGSRIPVGTFEDENGNSIVFENGDYRISVDRPNNARKAILWHKEEVSGKIYWAKRGVLNTSLSELRYQEEGDTDFVDYLKISEVEIEKEHRGKGYGNQLYKAIIDYKGDNIVGLLSYTPNRVNKSQVPSI